MSQNASSFEIPYHFVTAKHNQLGYSVELYVPSDAVHRPAVKQFIDGHYYEALSHTAFKSILDYKGNRNVVHAGAFFGDMLDTFSRNAKTVFAFEPVLANYYLAKRNIDNLGLANVSIMNAGLGDTNALIEICTSDEEGRVFGGGSSFRNYHDDCTTERVPVFRLDDLPISDVCLLQLDVEDMELSVLRGAEQLIKDNQPIILVEDNRAECAAFLIPQGYTEVFTSSGLTYWATKDDHEFVASLC